MREFKLKKNEIRNSWFMFLVFLVLFLVSLVPILNPDIVDQEDEGLRKTFLFFPPFLFVILIALFSFVRNLKYVDVLLDDEGLWLKHKDRDGNIIKWCEIAFLFDRSNLQSLDIQDINHNLLLRIGYDLEGFETLKGILLEKMPKTKKNTDEAFSFNKHPLHHVSYAAISIILTGAGIYLGMNGSAELGYGMALLSIVIAYEYFTTVYHIAIVNKRALILYPMRRMEFTAKDIKAVKSSYNTFKGKIYPQVELSVTGTNKSMKFKHLGKKANSVYSALNNLKGNR